MHLVCMFVLLASANISCQKLTFQPKSYEIIEQIFESASQNISTAIFKEKSRKPILEAFTSDWMKDYNSHQKGPFIVHLLVKFEKILRTKYAWVEIQVINPGSAHMTTNVIENSENVFNTYDEAKAELLYNIAKKKGYAIQSWGLRSNISSDYLDLIQKLIYTEVAGMDNLTEEQKSIIKSYIELWHIHEHNLNTKHSTSQQKIFTLLYDCSASSSYHICAQLAMNKDGPKLNQLLILTEKIILSNWPILLAVMTNKLHAAENGINTDKFAGDIFSVIKSYSEDIDVTSVYDLSKKEFVFVKSTLDSYLMPRYYAFKEPIESDPLTSFVSIVYELRYVEFVPENRKLILAVIPVTNGSLLKEGIECYTMDAKGSYSESENLKLYNEFQVRLANKAECKPLQIWNCQKGVWQKFLSYQYKDISLEVVEKEIFDEVTNIPAMLEERNEYSITPLEFALQELSKHTVYVLYQLSKTKEEVIPKTFFFVVKFGKYVQKQISHKIYELKNTEKDAKLYFLEKLRVEGGHKILDWFTNSTKVPLNYRICNPLVDLVVLNMILSYFPTIEIDDYKKYDLTRAYYVTSLTDENENPMTNKVTIVYYLDDNIYIRNERFKYFDRPWLIYITFELKQDITANGVRITEKLFAKLNRSFHKNLKSVKKEINSETSVDLY